MFNPQKRIFVFYRVLLPILLRKTCQRQSVTYDVRNKLQHLNLSYYVLVLCHKIN